MTVIYEWDCETVADGDSADYADGEVIDHCHGATFREVKQWSASFPPEPGTRHQLVLVRDDDEGRSWAEVDDGKLPEVFSDAGGDDVAKVPVRFVREVEREAEHAAA